MKRHREKGPWTFAESSLSLHVVNQTQLEFESEESLEDHELELWSSSSECPSSSSLLGAEEWLPSSSSSFSSDLPEAGECSLIVSDDSNSAA